MTNDPAANELHETPATRPDFDHKGVTGARKSNKEVAAYLNAIRACGSDWSSAVDLLARLTRHLGGADVFAVSSALSVCGRGGAWRKALELFHEVPVASRDLVLYHTTLSALQRVIVLYFDGGR